MRALDLLSSAIVPSDQVDQARLIINALKPEIGPNSSFVKWLDTTAAIENAPPAYQEVMTNGTALEIASILHFGRPEIVNPIVSNQKPSLIASLSQASQGEVDAETRAFIESAIALLK